jgi:hypothetical protein
MPPLHDDGQTVPHPPQLFGSVEVSTHVPPQFVKPGLQAATMHTPLVQAGVPFGTTHT